MTKPEGPAPSPELRLLLACIRLEPRATLEDLAHAAKEVQDWPRFVWLAQEHRVIPQVAPQLRDVPSVPESVRHDLLQLHQQIGFQNLHQSKALLDAIELLSSAGIDALPFKGPALAEHLYGGVAQRQFRDLDILVPRDQALEAVALLERNGYRWPGRVSNGLVSEYLRLYKDIELVGPGNLVLEVHWELLGPRFREKARTDAAWQSSRQSKLLEHDVLALSSEAEAPYLVLHGAKHAYKRLLWLQDLALVLQGAPASAVRELRTDAISGHFVRRLDLSLLLAKRFFGIDRLGGEAEPGAARLAAKVAAWIEAEQTFDLPSTQIITYQAQCFDHRRTGARYLARSALAPSLADRPHHGLPFPFNAIGYATRPFRLAVEYGKRRVRERRSPQDGP